jgi:hypothetical protein
MPLLENSSGLMNVPEPNQRTLVEHMIALLKPGGTIALQD